MSACRTVQPLVLGGQEHWWRRLWPSSPPPLRPLWHPLHLPFLDIHEVRGRLGARPEAGRYAPLWAILGLLPLCCWACSLTGREIWPAQPYGLILSTEKGNSGCWSIFLSHHKKAGPLPALHLHQHKGCLFSMCMDFYNILPLRKMISDCCLQGTEEIVFGKGPARARLLRGHVVLPDLLNTTAHGCPAKGPSKPPTLVPLYGGTLVLNDKHLETEISPVEK